MKSQEIRNFKWGIVDAVEPQSIPLGSFSKALNFLTKGDKAELRRGYSILGLTDAGSGRVSGLHVMTKLDSVATQVPLRTRNRKIEYYDSVTDDWIEIGSNTLPVGADGEDVAFDSYDSQAGAQTFLSSPNSSIYKILNANPGSITDLVSTTYRGRIRIKQNRMFLWNRKDVNSRKDEQNPYLSYIDARAYTTVTTEATTSLGGTLAFKAGGAKRTCFGILLTITATGEVYTDNRDGTLTGSLGGTGTIDYTTGVYTVSNPGVGTVDYQWEDSTNTGIADFSFSSPTRTAGQGNVFLQGDGGPLQAIESYGETEYCGHLLKIWALTNGRDDTTATNLIFRDREGIPNWRAMKATSIGIVYINAIDPGKPTVKLLGLQRGSTAIDGVVISKNIDLSGYVFDKCWIKEFEDFILIGCRLVDSTINNRVLVYNKIWKSFDVLDYYADCAAIFNGALLLGESLTGNVITAFSGVADDDSVVSGFCEFNIWDLGYTEYLKACKSLHLEGDIGPDQVIDVMASVDRGPFVVVGQIKGSGTYVDRTQRVDVGSLTLGRGTVSGGSSGIEAYHYFVEIPLRVGKFENIKFKLETGLDEENSNAEGIGYFSVSLVRPYDIRIKSEKIPRKYR